MAFHYLSVACSYYQPPPTTQLLLTVCHSFVSLVCPLVRKLKLRCLCQGDELRTIQLVASTHLQTKATIITEFNFGVVGDLPSWKIHVYVCVHTYSFRNTLNLQISNCCLSKSIKSSSYAVAIIENCIYFY